MIFGKTKKRKTDMIDVRDLQKRGIIKIPKRKLSTSITKSKEGFIELSDANPAIKATKEKTKSNAEFFNLTPTSTPKPEPTNNFSTSQDGYNKREVDTKVTELDNKIYKLEQRIELLEKKLDVNHSNNTGVIGW